MQSWETGGKASSELGVQAHSWLDQERTQGRIKVFIVPLPTPTKMSCVVPKCDKFQTG